MKMIVRCLYRVFGITIILSLSAFLGKHWSAEAQTSHYVSLTLRLKFAEDAGNWQYCSILLDDATIRTDVDVLDVNKSDIVSTGQCKIESVEAYYMDPGYFKTSSYVFDSMEIFPNTLYLFSDTIITLTIKPRLGDVCETVMVIIDYRKLRSLASLCPPNFGRCEYSSSLSLEIALQNIVNQKFNSTKSGTVYLSEKATLLEESVKKPDHGKFIDNRVLYGIPIGYYRFGVEESHYYETFDKKGRRMGAYCSDYYANKTDRFSWWQLILPRIDRVRIVVPP